MKRPKIILDYGVNHEGNIEKALIAIEIASNSGVDAIKFQHYNPEALKKPTNYCLTFAEYILIGRKCKALNLRWGISLFDTTWEHVPYFQKFGVYFFKIATSQVKIKSLISMVDTLPKETDIIISLTPGKVQSKFHKVSFGRKNIDFLVCESEYPCYNPPLFEIADNPNLGYSCHTPSYHACIAAQMLGAPVIEKHFTLNHNQSEFRDHRHALDPKELREWMGWVKFYGNNNVGEFKEK